MQLAPGRTHLDASLDLCAEHGGPRTLPPLELANALEQGPRTPREMGCEAAKHDALRASRVLRSTPEPALQLLGGRPRHPHRIAPDHLGERKLD
jgi:hypothetical protein